MSQVGIYRYKLTPTTDQTVTFYVQTPAGQLEYPQSVKVRDYCDSEILLKYLDSNGQYRFFNFNRFYQKSDNPTLLGTYGKIISDIYSGQSNERVIGYKNSREISCNADVTADELELLKDIYTSPSIYMYVGTTGDTDYDWLEVQVKNTSNNIRVSKGNAGNVSLTIVLPEHFAINRM